MKSKKHDGDITPSKKSSKQISSDVEANIQNESTPHRSHAISKYLSDDTVRHTLPRKIKVGASKSDGGSTRSSRPSSANSNLSVDDHVLAEEHNNMISDVKALSDCLLDLQAMVNLASNLLLNMKFSRNLPVNMKIKFSLNLSFF